MNERLCTIAEKDLANRFLNSTPGYWARWTEFFKSSATGILMMSRLHQLVFISYYLVLSLLLIYSSSGLSTDVLFSGRVVYLQDFHRISGCYLQKLKAALQQNIQQQQLTHQQPPQPIAISPASVGRVVQPPDVSSSSSSHGSGPSVSKTPKLSVNTSVASPDIVRSLSQPWVENFSSL